MFPCLAHEINTYILNISGIANIFYLATSSDKFVHYWSSLGRCQARDFFLLFSRLQKSSVINLDTIKLGVIAPHKCASLLGRFFYLSVKEHIFFRRVKRRLGGIDKSRDWAAHLCSGLGGGKRGHVTICDTSLFLRSVRRARYHVLPLLTVRCAPPGFSLREKKRLVQIKNSFLNDLSTPQKHAQITR